MYRFINSDLHLSQTIVTSTQNPLNDYEINDIKSAFVVFSPEDQEEKILSKNSS